ncbi:MAG: tRNA nucleotidyltransferase (CCA-adding enzyme) [Candidatus Azotimanducaceae bacterium]|jgi:tRNA nucleotidyltransferase (CCA-adding enzyme)
MDIYLVGGAVRDKLMNLPVTDHDWVVVGGTENELLQKGYSRVGKDFPVFLHPKTKEEYALARIERKTATGHTGFVCDASETVTLEQDLQRRDLTVNAIAKDEQGNLIDPYGGVEDLQNSVFRHVSKAFEEDPLRILRIARFSARFPSFSIHPDTKILIVKMVSRDDLSELAPERIYMEIDKALTSSSPSKFFNILDQVGAAEKLWPELGQETLPLLDELASISNDREERLAALFWTLKKPIVVTLQERLKLPNHLVELALQRVHYETWKSLDGLSAENIVKLLYDMDAFRRNERFQKLNAFFSTMSSIIDKESSNQECKTKWLHFFEAVHSIQAKSFLAEYSGAALGKAMRAAQIKKVANLI